MSAKVTAFAAAGTLDGTEIAPVIKGGVQKRTTTQDIANLALAAAATAEFIRDTIATALAASAGITVTPNDPADTITVGLDTETVQDIVAGLLAAGSGITLTYNDAGNVETVAVDTEAVQDIIGALLAAATGANSGIVVTYNDAGNAESVGLASSAFQTLTDAATIAWDMSAGFNAKVTLGGNRIIGTPTNPIEGRTYTLQLIQDGTGSRTITSWG
jgi:hypothetical protein